MTPLLSYLSIFFRQLKFSYPFLYCTTESSCFKTSTIHPFCFIRQIVQIIRTGTNPAAMGSTEWNDCFSGKIIALQKCIDNTRGLPVPNRVLKCSLPLEPSEKTGFNAMQKCVLCSFYLISDSAVTSFLIFQSTIRHISFQIPALHG